MTLQRTVQIIGLTLFLGLLVNAALGFDGWLPHDLFLRLDPAAALVTGVSARLWQEAFVAALAVLALTLILGRFFCGYLCPLGTTIDGCRKNASNAASASGERKLPGRGPPYRAGSKDPPHASPSGGLRFAHV
ncbi:MAG: 4Fe-4S binding protein [Desulfobacterales bacterium]|nr:4Fe-4S binding protein [Desulfobacterales bacterium]MDJ0857146.1 4Fe-4S binding protein [Desulfobacterales bacterium]MDJ0990239.1 4Fe-4S binding protein [Desulfobacterales bacterium]